MSKKLSQALQAIGLGCAGSILAFLIQGTIARYSGYVLLSITLFLIMIWAYRHYPQLFGIRWRYATSVLVLKNTSVLLILHPYHNVWLPPGHRVAFQEYPHESAQKAVLSETGYKVSFMESIHHQECVIDRNTLQLPQPYFVMREDQGHRGGIRSHYDFYYICEIIDEENRRNSKLDARWFTIEELDRLVAKGMLYNDIQYIIKKALKDLKRIT